jgi:large subunit ribosomal protein L28
MTHSIAELGGVNGVVWAGCAGQQARDSIVELCARTLPSTQDGQVTKESMMSKVCAVCGKSPAAGRNVSHSHRVTNRMFRPNIQKVKVVVDGSPKKMNVCTRCLKSGAVKKS